MLRREFLKGVAAALIAANTTLGFRSLPAAESQFYGYSIAEHLLDIQRMMNFGRSEMMNRVMLGNSVYTSPSTRHE